ncbi:MAG: hypothetical protein WCP21_20010, partial [Armatimonadota bacterium]
MSSVAGTSLSARFQKWSRNLEGYSGTRYRAVELYCGNAWSVVRRIVENGALGPRVRLWIASAGCGLLRPDTMLPPYSATFARGERDCVVRDGDADVVAAWWKLLAGTRKLTGVGVGSIADIARKHSGEVLIVALSSEYLS